MKCFPSSYLTLPRPWARHSSYYTGFPWAVALGGESPSAALARTLPLTVQPQVPGPSAGSMFLPASSAGKGRQQDFECPLG